MPQFWNHSHKRLLDSRSSSSIRGRKSELSGIVLNVRDDEVRDGRVRLTKKSTSPLVEQTRPGTGYPEEQPITYDVTVVGAGPSGLMLA
jgi:hypothetical protein